MTLDELQRETPTLSKRCEPCTRPVENSLAVGDIHLIEYEGRLQYMYLTLDGRLVPAEEW